MSYELGDNVVITSPTDTVASGDVSFEIRMPSTSNGTYTMEVIDIDKFEVDFDVQPDFESTQRFRFNTPKLKFTILDALSNNGSFIGLISEMDFDQIMSIKMTLNNRSDYYYALKTDCKFDFDGRSVEIKGLYPYTFFKKLEESPTYSSELLPPDKSFVINTVFNGVLVDFNDDATDSTPSPSDLEKTTFVANFIEGVLGLIGNNATTYISSAFYYQTYSDFFDNNPQAGDRAMLFDAAAGRNLSQGENGEIGYDQAARYVLDFARSEGAYFGNILGTAFYACRGLKDNRSGYSATITSDDLLSLELIMNDEQVGKFEVEVRFFENNDGDDYTLDIEETLNASIRDDDGLIVTKKVDFNTIGGIDLDVHPSYSEYISGDDFNVDGATSFQLRNFAEATNHPHSSQGISREQMVFNSYKQALKYGVQFIIKGTVAGVSKILPHQWLDMSSDIHPLVNNKDFRLSKVSYNILEDTIEFEAYEF